MRMLKDYRKYRILYRAVLRMQGFCKSWEIRRAYMEVRSAAKVFQKHARSYLAHQKLLDMKESEDPALTKEKKKEEILKILYPERFGRGKMNLSGKRRPMRLQPVKVAGDDEGDVEYLEMPKFAIVHEGWLNVKIGMMGKWQKTYVALKQGTLTLFEDHESLTAIISYNMANCLVKAEDAQIVITRTEKLYKHKVRSFRDMGRRIKGPLWGQDVILFQVSGPPNSPPSSHIHSPATPLSHTGSSSRSRPTSRRRGRCGPTSSRSRCARRSSSTATRCR